MSDSKFPVTQGQSISREKRLKMTSAYNEKYPDLTKGNFFGFDMIEECCGIGRAHNCTGLYLENGLNDDGQIVPIVTIRNEEGKRLKDVEGGKGNGGSYTWNVSKTCPDDCPPDD